MMEPNTVLKIRYIIALYSYNVIYDWENKLFDM